MAENHKYSVMGFNRATGRNVRRDYVCDRDGESGMGQARRLADTDGIIPTSLEYVGTTDRTADCRLMVMID